MRLYTALAPLIYLVFCGAPASHFCTNAAPVAAPAAAAAAAPPAAPAAPANAAGVVPLPEDEALDPTEVVHKATTTDTKNSYRDICTDFCVYLYDSGDEFVLAPSTRTAFNAIDAQYDDTPKGKKQRTEAMRAKVKEWLIVDEKKEAGSRQQHKLLDFRRYKPEVVVKYMCSRKQIKKNPSTGQKEERLLGNSRYSAIRTALMTYLAEVYDHEWTSKQLAFMKKALKGISKETSKSAQNKGRQDDVEPGKKAMSFELYEKTNQWLIEQGDRSAVYARAFLAKTWSLACRSDSTQSIKTADLVWRDDASGIVFAHQKNDQDGSRARKPRHSYFNPIKWWVCPELALFEYLVLFPSIALDEERGAKLFRGGEKNEAASARFWNVLKKVYMEHLDELNEMGYRISDLGTHSIRKGAITYLTSGTTDGPSSIAACNRGGWSMGRMLNIYCLYERAGDHLCGRILSGLPTLSPDFTVLPPDFVVLKAAGETDEALANRKAGIERAVEDGIVKVFGQQPPSNLRRFARIGLAQALHCRDEMRAMLPPGAAVLAAPYHRLASFDAIKKCVLIRHPWDDNDAYWGSVTGIPSHVVVIGKQQQTYDLVKSLPDQIQAITRKELDDRAYGGTMSEHRMGQLFDRSVSAAIAPVQAQMNSMQSVLLALAAGNGSVAADSAPRGAVPEADAELQRYGGWKFVHGKHRRVPASFRFPDSTPENLLEHWFVGSEMLQVPPLEMLEIDDVRWQIRGDKNLRDARALVKSVVDEAKRQGIWGDGKHTAVELRQIYRRCRDNLGVAGNVTNSWKTALRKVREKKRRDGGGRVTSRTNSGRKRNRTVNNAGRVDCNPHHRNKRPRPSGGGGGAAGTGPLLRSRGERMVAQGLEALAPSEDTAQATIQQVQGQSFVDSIVGASTGATGGSAGGRVEHV